jgi:hypothetical protein
LSQKLNEIVDYLNKLHRPPDVMTYVKEHVVPVLFGIAREALGILKDAVDAIPPTWEKLIEARNLVSIKNVLFSKTTHHKAGKSNTPSPKPSRP